MAAPWDAPEEDEPSIAFRAFCAYRDLGPTRSVLAAWKQQKPGREKAERAPGSWNDWSQRFHWLERARQYDAHLEREARLLVERETIKRRAAMIKRHAQAGELLLGRGVEFFAHKKVESARDAIAAVGKGVDLERQAEGMPDWVIEIMNAPAEVLDERIAELECRRRTAFAGVPDSPGDALSALGSGNGHREPAG